MPRLHNTRVQERNYGGKVVGQHNRPNDPNKKPNTHVTKRPINYVQIGRKRTLTSKISTNRSHVK